MRNLELRILLILLLVFVGACGGGEQDEGKNKQTKVKKVPKSKPISIESKISEVKDLRVALLAKQEEFKVLEGHYKSQVKKVKDELIQEQRRANLDTFEQAIANKRIRNRLANLREYDAYLQEIKRRRVGISNGEDDLLTLSRSLEAKSLILSSMKEAEAQEFVQRVNVVITKYMPEANKLVINPGLIQMKSIKLIWEEIEKERIGRTGLSPQAIREERKEIEKTKQNKLNQQIWQDIRRGYYQKYLSDSDRHCESNCLLHLDDLTILPPEVAKYLIKWKGFSLILGLTNLSPETAEQLAKLEGPLLFLSDLNTLSSVAAERLAKRRGWRLWLGLTTLSSKTAEQLAKWGGWHLILPDLHTLSSVAAEQIAKWRGWKLLLGLTSLSLKTAEQLAKWKGGELSLPKLPTLSSGAAEQLAKWGGDKLNLRGLTNLSPEVAEQLARWKGSELRLNKLTTLSPEVAEQLAKWKGSELWLNKLTTLSLETASYLSRWNGEELHIGEWSKGLTIEEVRHLLPDPNIKKIYLSASFREKLSEEEIKSLKSLEVEIYFGGERENKIRMN